MLLDVSWPCSPSDTASLMWSCSYSFCLGVRLARCNAPWQMKQSCSSRGVSSAAASSGVHLVKTAVRSQALSSRMAFMPTLRVMAAQTSQEVVAQTERGEDADQLQPQLLQAALKCQAELAAYMKAATRSFWQPAELRSDARFQVPSLMSTAY